MQDPVHGPVGDLRGKLVAEQVERREGEAAEVWAGRGVAQVLRQPVAERRHPRTQAGVRAVPAEQLPELPSDRPEHAGGAGVVARRVFGEELPHQQGEVAGAARRRQRPHVLDPEVRRELVDPPWPRGVRGIWESHAFRSSSADSVPHPLIETIRYRTVMREPGHVRSRPTTGPEKCPGQGTDPRGVVNLRICRGPGYSVVWLSSTLRK